MSKIVQGSWLILCGLGIFIGWYGCSSSNDIVESRSRSIMGSLKKDSANVSTVIREGDQIEISVWGYPEFQTTATVKEAGTITLPLAGDIQAAGLTKDQLIAATKVRLKEFIQGDPEITVSITNPSTLKISVLGAVTRQDNFPVTGDVTLLEILSTAGGSTPESDLSHIRIIRRGILKQTSEVNLAASIETGNFEGLPRVHPGDVVFVPKRENVVRSFSDFLRDAVLLFGTFRVFY
ncbi:MAG TPA: polysaccharide biosynthesis/export family protein [Bacteroidota bacterium]|nr:polysaccharide biosynthesis/export family protein [Bacteroidota bacterium]